MNKYKRIFNSGFVLCAILLFCQCSKQLDSVQPKNQISQESLTDADIAKLRIGLYSQMENLLFSYFFDFDLRGENFKSGPGFSVIDPVNMSPSDAKITGLWQAAFQVLAKVNFLIETIDHSATPSSFASIKGEALYFRGLIYYNLATRWGGVPILTKSTYGVVPRASETEVWNQIKTDLTAAETMIPAFSNKFYLSAQAVQALLARVYLATNDKNNALVYADKVLSYATSSGNFSLATDAAGYASMFVSGNSSKELIFALANNTASNKHSFYGAVNDVDATWDYSPANAIFAGLYANKNIASNDKRKAVVFFADGSRITKFPNGKTGQQFATTPNADYTPIMVSRIAEMYLIKAEVQGPGSASETTLAPYFSARYSNPPVTSVVAALSGADFQNMILDERNREFYGEGFRWFDIKRTGRKDLLTTLSGRDYLMYYPVPQTEKDLAGYTQNEGY